MTEPAGGPTGRADDRAAPPLGAPAHPRPPPSQRAHGAVLGHLRNQGVAGAEPDGEDGVAGIVERLHREALPLAGLEPQGVGGDVEFSHRLGRERGGKGRSQGSEQEQLEVLGRHGPGAFGRPPLLSKL